MIFSYKEIDHNIYFFNEHIAYIFRQMFHYNLSVYDESLLVHPDFREIINAARKTILEPLKEIIVVYHNLPFGDKIQLQIAFSYNNSIDAFTDIDIKPIKFEELNIRISEKLKKFFINLWDGYPQVKKMESDFGTVKDHYDKLIDEDNCEALICPFCGIETFEPSEGKYREAYDHMVAKATYPFVSVNFKLLFPACFKCNSNEKRSTDTLVKDDGTRRAVYYPYDSTITHDNLEIKIVPLENYDAQNLATLLRNIKWQFELKRNGNPDERLDSWNEIYGIKRKYFERLNRLEKEWFYELQSKFKDSIELSQTFKDFEEKFMKSAKYQILISGMGIIKYSYFNFLFSTVGFEKKLNESIS
ncbi:hypothetical protein ACM55F_14485 [Flavobacterium sp. XS2P12]|uniref:hypothetical protein n=1 Tax=Flavobacterium melibiosi TaxID=3398734 RepID=UPI003A8BA496